MKKLLLLFVMILGMHETTFAHPIVRMIGKTLLVAAGSVVTVNVAAHAYLGHIEMKKYKQEANKCKKLHEALNSSSQRAIAKKLTTSESDMKIVGIHDRIIVADKSSNLCSVLELRKSSSE